MEYKLYINKFNWNYFRIIFYIMNYTEAINKAKEGYTLKLPNINAYFKWDYKDNVLRCDRYINEDISNRNDWFYIL